MNSPKHPLKLLAEIRPSRGYAARDGPSFLRRSVLQIRHKVQRVNFSENACDGPSCLRRSVLHFRREVQRVDPSTQILEFKCFGMKRSTDRCAYDGSSYLLSRAIRRATEKLHKCGTTKFMTVRRVIRRPSHFLSKKK